MTAPRVTRTAQEATAEHIAKMTALREAGWELYRTEECRMAVLDGWFDGLLGIDDIADGTYVLVPVESPDG